MYELFIDHIVEVSSPEAAELAKLLENTFRMINIGLVNEMAQICDKLGVSVWEVIEAAATKPFGFMKFTPGPGLGGHCIPLDPHYLAWKMRTLHYKTRMIELAGEINTEMPAFWVGKTQDALNDAGKPLKGSRVLVLGVAYKKDIDDLRESPALDILDLLAQKGCQGELPRSARAGDPRRRPHAGGRGGQVGAAHRCRAERRGRGADRHRPLERGLRAGAERSRRS